MNIFDSQKSFKMYSDTRNANLANLITIVDDGKVVLCVMEEMEGNFLFTFTFKKAKVAG